MVGVEKLYSELLEMGLDVEWDFRYTFKDGNFVKEVYPQKRALISDGYRIVMDPESNPQFPTVYVCWSKQKAIDDFDEFEIKVDATAQDIYDFLKCVEYEGGNPPSDSDF